MSSTYRVRRVAHGGAQDPMIGYRYADFNPQYIDGSYGYADLSAKAGNRNFRAEADPGPALKRRRSSYTTWNDGVEHNYFSYNKAYNAPPLSMSGEPLFMFMGGKVDGLNAVRGDVRPSCDPGHATPGDGADFMSRDEIERCSPSRKDGIDLRRETYLRQTYCGFLQDLGLRLDMPQTTIGTAMVLCHRFFVRRSHASHDRYLIATAALFLAGKSEETPRPLNSVVKLSYEICHKQNLALFHHMLSVDWSEKFKERVLEAEHMILTTLDFELSVQHPYNPLTSVLSKLGISQSSLTALAWSLINKGLRSSLWLQFKPHHIAAGAAILAAKFLNLDLSYYPNMWKEFQTTPTIAYDIVQQLMELV